MDSVLFYVFSATALASAVVVVAQPNPIYSAFSLIVTLCSLSAIYGLLGSPFIAVLQIVVYAGAIMVLFLFVLMLLNVKREAASESGDGRTAKGVALVLGVLIAAEVAPVLGRRAAGPTAPGFDASSASMAGQLFSTPYLYVFEATAVLILTALVGAVVLAKREP
jgi:NADH-quinone oxidoreductase subunit J